ncbi:PA26 p53-induced protein (sestrin) [Nesidiocoris tenuis]|uniref:PA26 p53-induced protein (Sestrin) n=2 Tax=Nesidiocoris tenuis TaxID=355587 RepID=A0ABN7AB20_9HEMI|nr:PA26 p53-induced protein (sestrin) [Nesidiocoris tenuis]
MGHQITHASHMLFIDAFLQNNRVDQVTQVMGYHPTYLDIFLRTQHFILKGDGPLRYDYRHFIAIMAAGRHQCSYLINLQKQEFLLQGGDQDWLRGLQYIPQKLRDLYEINKILAHRPWLLNKTHIQKLTKGSDSWSLAEVVHAIVLLAHFHSLSSFVFGCGVLEDDDEIDSPPKTPTLPKENGASAKEGWSEAEVGVDMLMERMKSLSERSEEYSETEMAKRFEKVESQSAELAPLPAPTDKNGLQVKAAIGQFVEDPTFLYEDFARRTHSGDIPTFRVQDYSWDDHGYSLVNRLYNDVGNLLDEKFKTAYNLTYYTMGGRKDVDTSRFRRAIWNYIQCMYGIRHDDYDYGEVNQLLERSLKSFIKSSCCYPERVTRKDYDRVLREFKHSEKVHVNIMVLEARMQAELLYALRAVMRYMT